MLFVKRLAHFLPRTTGKVTEAAFGLSLVHFLGFKRHNVKTLVNISFTLFPLRKPLQKLADCIVSDMNGIVDCIQIFHTLYTSQLLTI